MLLWFFLGLNACKPQQPVGLQLSAVADSSCSQVALHDGLENTQELDNLYKCLNQSGSFNAFDETVAQLFSSDRNGDPLGSHVVYMVNKQLLLEDNLWNSIDLLLDLNEQSPDAFHDFSALFLESLYGRPVENLPANMANQNELEQGLLLPFLRATPSTAQLLIDQPVLLQTFEQISEQQEVQDIGCMLQGMHESSDLRPALDSLIVSIGDAIERCNDHTNDKWSGASGDSFHDLFSVLLSSTDSPSPLEQMTPELLEIIKDPNLQHKIEKLFLEHQDNFEEIAGGLFYLADVDATSAPISTIEDSTLYRIIRLMAATNAPLDCNVEVLGFPINTVSIDNLAVEILDRISQEDPSTVLDAINLLDILDLGITQWAFDSLLESNSCPLITEQVTGDLEALQRIGDPQAEQLVAFTIEALAALRNTNPTKDQLPTVVTILSMAHQSDLSQPSIELVRDLDNASLLPDLLAIAPVLIEDPPSCSEEEILGIDAAISLLVYLLDEEESPAKSLTPLLLHLLQQPDVMLAKNNIANILQDPQTKLPKILDLIEKHDQEAMVKLIELFLNALQDEVTQERLLLMAENPSLMASLSNIPTDKEGPLPFIARLLHDGTIIETLDLMNWIIKALQSQPTND